LTDPPGLGSEQVRGWHDLSGAKRPNLPNRSHKNTVADLLHGILGAGMTYYIAEIDEGQKIAAVWIKEKTAGGPSVFDPKKHIFDPDTASGFFGASKEKIARWIGRAERGAQDSLNR